MLRKSMFAAVAAVLLLVPSAAFGQAAGGDLSGTYPNPTVVNSHLASPLPVAQGGTAATTASGARTSLGAAASGSNSDITALTGLTNPLWPALANMAALTGANWSAYAYSANHQGGLNILGYTSTNDGGQGSFAAVSSCTVDGGVCVQDSAGNYFQRLYAGNVRAAFWGANGNGSTDNTTAFGSMNTYMTGLTIPGTLQFDCGRFVGDYPTTFTGYVIEGCAAASGYTGTHAAYFTTISAKTCRAAVLDTATGAKNTLTGTGILNLNVVGIGATCAGEVGVRIRGGQLRATVANVTITGTGGDGFYSEPNEQAGQFGIAGYLAVYAASQAQAANSGPSGGCHFSGFDDAIGNFECGNAQSTSLSANYNLSFTATGATISGTTLTFPVAGVTVGVPLNGDTIFDTTGSMAVGRVISACSSGGGNWTCTVSGGGQTVGSETVYGVATASMVTTGAPVTATFGCIFDSSSGDTSISGPGMCEDSDAGILNLSIKTSTLVDVRSDANAGFGIVNGGSANYVAPRIWQFGAATGLSGSFDGFINLPGSNGPAPNLDSPVIYVPGGSGTARYGINDMSSPGTGVGTQARYNNPIFNGSMLATKNVQDGTVGPAWSLPGSGQLVLTALSTTPSVCDWLNWRTNNSSSTAYTNFLCGVNGDVRTIRVTDGHSSFVNSATLNMCGGVNHTGINGETLTFLNYNGAWYQTNCGWPNAVTMQGGTSAPTAPASTASYAMQGLAATCNSGTCTFTPQHSGKVRLTISGTILASVLPAAGDGIQYKLYYGTGSAPSNAAAVTGTQCSVYQQGYMIQAVPTAAADVQQPFSISCTASLTVGTTYWIDLAAESLGTVSRIGLSNTMLDAIEN